ncbi:MAG: hypothetical protein Q8K51_10295 [Nitrospirota bacterium]|nr:hypothetical protein [Nitrospirota bacterium]
MRCVDKNKKRITAAVLILLTAVLLGVGCSSMPQAQWGKVLKYGSGGSLFYTSDVTEEEARRLRDYFLKIKTFQDEPPIVQLARKGNVYEVRMVVDKEVIEKELPPEVMGPVEAAGLLAEEVSKEVFNGAKVEWHLCDDSFKTLRIGSY